MKIEKGKLYYDTRTNQLFKAYNYAGEAREGITDKIAVHCATKDDKLYVAKKYGLEWVEKHTGLKEPYVDLADDYLFNVNYSGFTCYHVITIDQFKEFYPPDEEQDIEVFNPQPHYDNSKGSLYKLATELKLNHWEFDIFKRLVRCRKKGQFKQDLQKIKDTIDIYINEY